MPKPTNRAQILGGLRSTIEILANPIWRRKALAGRAEARAGKLHPLKQR